MLLWVFLTGQSKNSSCVLVSMIFWSLFLAQAPFSVCLWDLPLSLHITFTEEIFVYTIVQKFVVSMFFCFFFIHSFIHQEINVYSARMH